MKRQSSSRLARRGFTLMEVMLVVAIIGLLAVFIVPRVFGMRGVAMINLTKAAVKSGLNGALNHFQVVHGTFPTELRHLIEKPEEGAGGGSAGDGGEIVYQNLEQWQARLENGAEALKDPWGHEYIYKFPGEFNKDGYDLSSAGPDGQPDTDDDIRNWSTDEAQ